MSDPIIGSSLTSSGVVAKKTFTEEIVIGNDSINDISHEYTDAGVNSVPSSKALHDGLDRLDQEVKKIDPNNNFYRDNTVITLPLIDMTFAENSDWQILNWLISDNKVSFTGKTYTVQNFVGIPSDVIPFEGYYFILVDIPRLDSGKIVLYDDGGNILKTFTEYGKFPLEVHVPNADIAEFKFVAEGVFPGEVVTINSVLFSRITPRLREYMNYLFSGGSGELTYDQVIQLINQSLTNTVNNLNTRITPIEEDLDDHRRDINNPHQVTRAQIGAAAASHTHTPASLGAAPVVHSHEPEECGAAPLSHTHSVSDTGAAPLEHTHTPEECGAAGIAHTHTADQVGAAPLLHYHTHIEVGAAPSVHTHDNCVTNADVTTAINSALAEVVTGSVRALKPMTITELELGSLPLEYENMNFSAPVHHAKFPYLIHEANSYYDLYDGMAVTNIDSLIDHPIEYAFKKHLTNVDYTTNVAGFFSNETILSKKVLVEYRFHQDRTIDKFSLFKDLTGAIGGVPTILDLYVDDVYVTQLVGEDTSAGYTYWAETNDSVEKVLLSSVTGKKFSFVISKVYVDSNSHWGIRIEFNFTDSNATSLEYTNPIGIAAVGLTGTQPKEINFVTPVDLPIDPDVKTPLYVNLEFVTDEIGTVTYFKTSHLPMEFGEKAEGIALFNNTFDDKNHTVFGNLSVTSEKNGYLVENIYSDIASYWLTEDLVVDATFTHTFIDSYDLEGYQLVFPNQMNIANTIPNQWNVTITYSDDTTEVIDTVTNFIPYKLNDPNKAIVYTKKNLDLSQSVKKISLQILGTNGQSSIGIGQFIPKFKSNFYHIYKNIIDDPKYFPFGKLRIITSHDGTWKGYKHEGLVTGDGWHVPIDGMKIQPDYPVEHIIPNPFNTKLIDISMFTYSSASAISPRGDVIDVTEQKIKLMTYSAGQYSVSIKRRW